MSAYVHIYSIFVDSVNEDNGICEIDVMIYSKGGLAHDQTTPSAMGITKSLRNPAMSPFSRSRSRKRETMQAHLLLIMKVKIQPHHYHYNEIIVITLITTKEMKKAHSKL